MYVCEVAYTCMSGTELFGPFENSTEAGNWGAALVKLADTLDHQAAMGVAYSFKVRCVNKPGAQRG